VTCGFAPNGKPKTWASKKPPTADKY